MNILSESLIRDCILEDGISSDIKLHFCESVDSTNDYVMSLSNEVDDGFVACVANKQLAGRGRNGNVWQSPSGANIYMSIGCRYQIGFLQNLSGLSLACGVAIAQYVESLGVSPQLKWPNDILVDGKKLAGILIETRVKGSDVFVVAGVGVNVDMQESDAKHIDQPWIDLKRCLPATYGEINRNQLVASLLVSVVRACKVYQQKGIKAFLKDWMAYDFLKDKSVRIYADGKESLAEACGINEDGSLKIKVDGREESVYAADVKVRLEN